MAQYRQKIPIIFLALSLFSIALSYAGAPNITIEVPANNTTYNSSSVGLNYTVADTGSSVDKCWYVLDGGSNNSLASCANTTLPSPLEEGNHSVIVYANDSAGLANSSTSNFSIDTSSTMVSSLLGIDFYPADFSFSSSSYVTGIQVFFNTTVPTRQNVLLMNLNLVKLSSGTSNMVYSRVLVDDVEVGEEMLRVLDSKNEEISTMFRPLTFNVSGPAQHNITVQFKRTGGGSIGVNDVDMVLLRMRTTSNGSVRTQVVDALYNFTSTSFAPNFNWTISKTMLSPTYITMKQIMNCTNITNATYYFYNNGTGVASPFWLRTCNTPLYRSGGTFIESDYTLSHNESVYSKISAGTCYSNITVFDFDLRDANRTFIRGF